MTEKSIIIVGAGVAGLTTGIYGRIRTAIKLKYLKCTPSLAVSALPGNGMDTL